MNDKEQLNELQQDTSQSLNEPVATSVSETASSQEVSTSNNTEPPKIELESDFIESLKTEKDSSDSKTITFRKTPLEPKPPLPWVRVIILAILTVAFAIFGVFAYIRQQLSPVSPGVSAPTEFEVLPGWGANQVARELEDTGLIRNARVFSYYLRYEQLDRSIGEGLYDLDPAMTAQQIALTLSQGGRPRTVNVIVPEGFRMKDIAQSLASVGLADEASWLALFETPNEVRPEYLDADQPLEGFLFPATYEIPVRSTAEDIVKMFLERFSQELTPEVQTKLTELGWTVSGWVTLASMVQAEAANSSEMPIIAGVFLNRLDQGMPLQSDPTVAYGLGKNLPELDANAGDFQQDHAWNTYTRTGLPATPINNPGHDALQAVLSPQRFNEEGQAYFYFLHGTDEGQPVFRPNLTFEDHARDIELYLRSGTE